MNRNLTARLVRTRLMPNSRAVTSPPKPVELAGAARTGFAVVWARREMAGKVGGCS